MLKCHASLFCNNSPNSSDSSWYDWYDDEISNTGPQVCATALTADDITPSNKLQEK